MANCVPIMDRLLEDPTVNSREHSLETASYHVSNVKEKFEGQFDQLVREISKDWGLPIFNASFEETPEGKKNNTPSWCVGTARDGGVPKTLRLAYWKREQKLNYLALRTEVDEEKDRPLYYELVVGSRRRATESINVGKMRHSKPNVWETIRSWFVFS